MIGQNCGVVVLDGIAMLHLYIVAFLKMPHAIQAWLPCMCAKGEDRLISADGFAEASFGLYKKLSGVDASWEYEQIQSKKQNLLLGPYAFLKNFDMMPHDLKQGSCVSAETLFENSENEQFYCAFGRKGKETLVVKNRFVWDSLMGVVEDFDQKHPEGCCPSVPSVCLCPCVCPSDIASFCLPLYKYIHIYSYKYKIVVFIFICRM